MLPVSPLEYLVNKVTPDYHAMIDLLGGKQSNAWKEKSVEMATSLKEMNDREAWRTRSFTIGRARICTSSKISGRSLWAMLEI